MLVVDLDGTLLRSDILFESFWSALGKDWRVPFQAANSLLKSKAVMKRELAQSGPLDVETLPYDPDVIAYVQDWRAKGGHAALVTASDERIAKDVVNHLGIFDEVYGSDGERNLKGPAKAAFLTQHYTDGFAYMGDAQADIPVWSQATRAITVNAPTGLRNKVEKLDAEVEHLQTHSNAVKPYIKAIRPHQWLKNVLIFLPMMAAHQYDVGTFFAAFFAFVSFSMVASSAYVMNDLLDLAADRAHPRKCKRPFAAGDIPIAHGTWMAFGMLALGAIIAASINMAFLGIMIFYYIATTAYSLNLKRRIVVDIMMLAGLYTIRIIAGGYATQIPLSVWLVAFSVFFFLSLASVKRQAELIDTANRGKLEATGRGYQVDDLPLISQVAISSGYVSVLVMALYINSPTVMQLYNSPLALWGVCLILLYWLTRVIMITHRGHMHDDPVVFAAKDRTSQLCFLAILFCVVWSALL
ncbi:MAG: UbiA family prenyltransferase [Sedimentitalea sp.]|uniref:UbiA family prenyltransferase n=1 Tax=Sedimentitalea sp. TaxID=2048915 RepID=UPI003262D589